MTAPFMPSPPGGNRPGPPKPPPLSRAGLIVLLAAFAVVLVALTAAITVAISKGGDASGATGSTDTLELPPAAAEPVEQTDDGSNERGNLAAVPGDPLIVADPATDAEWITFTVDKISVDPGCTVEFAESPDNGHFVVLDVSVTTSPDMPPDQGVGFANPYDFTVVGTNGLTEAASSDSGAAYYCYDTAEMLPDMTLQPGSQYQGKVVLDVSQPHGVVVYAPVGASGGGALGWEWKY